jgi:hypothetical protein
MNDKRFTLFMMVIKAAMEGNYMHGNGAQWFIKDHGVSVMVDTQNDEKHDMPSYMGVARVDMDTVRSLEGFLMSQDAPMYDSEFPYAVAKAAVGEAVHDGRLLYTNGSQWYFLHTDGTTVLCTTLGVRTPTVLFTQYSKHASWKYMQQNGSYRATISDDTMQYMGW